MINYYPEELTVARFNRMSGDFKIQDWAEYQRLADVEEKKRRGKGVPKKAKTPGAYRLVYELSNLLTPPPIPSGQSEDVSQAVECTARRRLLYSCNRSVYILLVPTRCPRAHLK